MKKTLAIFAAVLIAAPALADHRTIEMDDGAFVPSLRATFDISPRGEQPSVPHTGHGIEIGLSGASNGEDQQTRDPGDSPLTFGGQTFVAPGVIRYEFDFRYFELAYRYRHFFGESRTFGIEGIGGIGSAEMDITATTATQRTSETLQSGGLVLGFGIVWKFLPQTSLQSRLTIFSSGEREGVTAAARFDVMVAHALARNVSLRGGLTRWGVVSARNEDGDDLGASPNSQINVGFGGLAAGLEVMF
jgi:hypothetical protein